MKILHVVGARPNFPKVAPLISSLKMTSAGVDQFLIHTGQHYDYNMSRIFFEQLDLPEPDDYLGVGPGTHAEQTARVMMAFEPVLLKYSPDLVIVVGDVNSTLACALVCAKVGIKVAHVESGLRSSDRTMPEEINRILTDQLADLHFTPSRDAGDNLLREGIPVEKIHFVGNVMIDTLVRMLPFANEISVLEQYNLNAGKYILVTLHRPANVDHPRILFGIMSALVETSRNIPVIFPVHPRTRRNIEAMGHFSAGSGLFMVDPLGYLEFLSLERNACLVVTDSGGVQEETTFLGVPCLTVRPNTERPITISQGTNRLVGNSQAEILTAIQDTLDSEKAPNQLPQYWDGHASERIARIILSQRG